MNIMVAQYGVLENTAKVRIFLLFEPYFSIKKTVYVQKNKKRWVYAPEQWLVALLT